MMEQIECRTRDEAAEVLHGTTYRQRADLERLVATLHRRDERFLVPGICAIDGTPVAFLVDRRWGAQRLDDGTWLPNWRERLECPICGLNNRQRALATLVLQEAARRTTSAGNASVYVMEQVTPAYKVLSARLPDGSCLGSEATKYWSTCHGRRSPCRRPLAC
jgi:hypothetical protein